MRNVILGLVMTCSCLLNAQDDPRNIYSLEASYFYGNIIPHNPHISHLRTHWPEGLIMSYNKKTFGDKAWESRYNFPDVGYSVIYQNLKNAYLGENYGLYAHLGFYFLRRNLVVKVGQGLAYATDPYDSEHNPMNNAYGSRILSSTFFTGNYRRENIILGFGIQAGLSMVHYSNADFRSPNNSTNTFAVNLGVNYLVNPDPGRKFLPHDSSEKFHAPLGYNLVLRSGVNTLGLVGSKAYPFLTVSAYADKSVNHKSTLHAGAEFFVSRAMEEFISYQSRNSSETTTGQEDARRIGLFLGHQLIFNKLSFITHLGYYVYYPYDQFVDRVYNRIGLQHDISGRLWGSVSVRSHWADAEAVELSLGFRL